MSIRNLEHAFHPKSVALIGASDKAGSVGRIVMRNIVSGGFEGELWPVNPKHETVDGRTCYPNVQEIPGIPDLAVIVTPPRSVPGLIRDLGEKGTRATVVITAGLNEANGLRQEMLDAAKPYLLRIIGPNTVGLLLPQSKLNASFAHMDARPGQIALLSQSGAIATSLIDWAADNQIGFSQIVSLGDMADVDVADCLDLLAGDAGTKAIVMYLESIPHPRKFMSAARAAARLKPVIAIKPGRHSEAAKAAATHTGALSGADRVVDAALRRAGVLRVGGLAELFDATETLARFPMLEQVRVGIVTNGGGAGVLAVDQLMENKGELAELSAGTLERLDQCLPDNWSHSNPVDIIGDAPPERFKEAVEVVAADPGTDAILVLNCPTGLASPIDAATAVASLVDAGTVAGKPVFACWLGEHTARKGRRVLVDAGVASYETPAAAANAISYLSDWSRAQRVLMRVPDNRYDEKHFDREVVYRIFRQAASEGRNMLAETEAKAAISAYGISVPRTLVARTAEEVEGVAGELLSGDGKVVVKLLSKSLTHKSDVGGVVLDVATPKAAREAAVAIGERVRALRPDADIDGFAVQPMVMRKHAQELILGASRDPVFGPTVLFGAGGTMAELVNDTAIGLPPLDDVLAGDLIDSTHIGRLLAGYRDRQAANRTAIIDAVIALSQMIIDFPCLVSMDINPLLADATGVIALDARIEIDLDGLKRSGPNPDLAIRPYPSNWKREVALKGGTYDLRPIRPDDVVLYPLFLSKVSPHDLRLRFLALRRTFSEDALRRLTQVDYDRDMAFIALDKDGGELAGIARLSSDPDHEIAEYAVLVRTDLQGRGLGWELLRQLIDFARADGVKRIEGLILSENIKMLTMCREFGFSVVHHPSDTSLMLATLDLQPA
ncbi:GNAT family N-acetyltransferase [Phyllobacterium brassicacearum]|uniref:GNAT family N-acetyltransferase n=1 Tax=Phyllobacterium brassicacearum TaxID=314235 RepID=A0A2P7B996_9HYPH|nr:bifunctional acetate--CoA ligase family protein/GNAT family N-acetyltransferase [Phyllobacterium brassicacearum]PSH63027.1 GNAT family N-acetyltransferase [Phyllobacterium brassicacearum]TDQ13809.1 acetyltransferase [Phyllobacterium brassicacearum]